MTGRLASIGILEDDSDLANYLANIVRTAGDFQLAFVASTLEEAREAVSQQPLDACLVDLELPDGSGFDFTLDLKTRSDAKVLILTVLGDRRSVLTALKCGADGYLLKDTDAAQIIRDLKCVLAGDTPISPQAATHLLGMFRQVRPGRKHEDDVEQLTDRERETLQLFERGLTYQETANALKISQNTVRTHVKSIYSKLSVNSKSEAVYEARQMGWLRE